MAAYVHDSQFMTRRSAVLAAIIALHVVVIWALATGLARRAIEVLAPPIQTQIVQEVKPKDLPPPPPPPQFERPPVEVPPPEVNINVPVETHTTAITNVTTRHVAAKPAPPPRVVRRTAGGPGSNFPDTEDYYPAASRRLEEQGTTIVHVCVGANGRLTQEPTVQKSSGSSRLDEGALRLAKAGSGRYRPATEDGKPVDSCFAFGIKFQMR